MFQFAIYAKLKKLKKDVHLDSSAYHNDNFRIYELDKFCGIDPKFISFTDFFCEHGVKGRALFLVKKRFIEVFKRVYRDKIIVYQPDIYKMNWIKLEGYWQNEKYFSDMKEEIRDYFTFDPKLVDNRNALLAQRVQNENSVSIHIRRGDYIDPQNRALYGNVCTIDYYRKASDFIFQRIDNPIFYLFSDDMDWTKENISLLLGMEYDERRVTYIDFNRGEKSFLDMYLMSKCKHHIIANSTFSWWGAWLGTNEDKIVISPSRWFDNQTVSDIICDDWIRIEG